MTNVAKTEKNVVVNEYAASLSKRYDDELKNNKAAASLGFISKCALTVSQKSVYDMLKKSEVKTDFAQDSVQAGSSFDMKALDTFASMMQFASGAITVDKLKSNVEEVFRTLVLFKKNNEEFCADDITLALDKTLKVAKERQHLYYRRTTHFGSAKRHACMNMRAIVALNLVTPVSKTKYKVNDNAVMKAIEARLAA